MIDEFHHAAAASYRRVVKPLESRLPTRFDWRLRTERMARICCLCAEDNLVFECDSHTQGIERGLLSRFTTWGTRSGGLRTFAWRNSRFDPDALELAVITRSEQARRCASGSNMRNAHPGVLCLTTSRRSDGPKRSVRRGSLPRRCTRADFCAASRSLFDLERGALRVVFSVDMFNEGVDVPAIDTVCCCCCGPPRRPWSSCNR